MPDTDPKRYDAFLSYNSHDRPAVLEIAERLRGERLHLFLDAWDLQPGHEFLLVLADALSKSKSCVVFLGPKGLAPWQKQEIQVAIDKRIHDESYHVIPVLLPGTERPRRGDVAHVDFLLNASWVEFVKSLDDEPAFQRLVWAITGTTRRRDFQGPDEPVCPYRGLEVFRPEDERFFFGRENLTGWLVSTLRREVRAGARGVRFLGVIGPSGSGKSSVVLAGLVPKLKAGAIEGSGLWHVLVVRPGSDPLKYLTEQLVPRMRAIRPDPLNTELGEQSDLLDRMRRGTPDSAAVLDQYVGLKLAEAPADRRLLIVVDQFEELFTNRPQDDAASERAEDDRAAYLGNLLNAAAVPGGRVVVLLTMRSDFLGRCAIFPQLSAVLSAHQELVGPMTPGELREAIEQPAFVVGHEVEPALVERLLSDVKGQTGALPLLQFALTEVWKRRDGRRITLRAYEELGADEHGKPRGIEGALEHRANEIYGRLSRDDQELCRRVFLRLVQPGEGTEDTKRRVSYHELLPASPEKAGAVLELIYVLSNQDARLITTEGAGAAEGWVEVAHEALIRGWTQLRRWVDADRAGLRTQRRLTESAQEWTAAASEHKDEYLLSGARLATCREWVQNQGVELNDTEAAFLSACVKASEDALDKERRLREAAETAACHQKRLGRRFLATAIGAIGLAIACTVLAFLANQARTKAVEQTRLADQARTKAEEQTQLAEARRLASLSEQERARHLDLSVILAVEALGSADIPEGRNSLFQALFARRGIKSFLHTARGEAKSVAFSPDGKTLTAGYGGQGVDGVGRIVLWDLGGRQCLVDAPLPDAAGNLSGAALSADGKTLAVGYNGGMMLWDMDGRQPRADMPLPIAQGHVSSVAFSPDGEMIAAGYAVSGQRGGIVLWMPDQKRPVNAPLPVAAGNTRCVAFSPNGKLLAVAYGIAHAPDDLLLWDVETQKWVTESPMTLSEGEIKSLAFSPDSRTLTAGHTGRHNGGALVWDLSQRPAPKPDSLDVADGQVTSVAFSPDGKTLAVGYGGNGKGGVVLWDRNRRASVTETPLAIGEGYVTAVAFSPDGKTLASAFSDGIVLWNVTRMTVAAVEVTSVAFSPDGEVLASADSGGVVLWSVARREPLAGPALSVPEGDVLSVTFSPDRQTLAAGYGGGAVIWNIPQRRRTAHKPLSVASGQLTSLALRPDGKVLAAGYLDPAASGGVVLWELNGEGSTLEPLPLPEGQVPSVAFSPDGKTLAAGYTVGQKNGLFLWDRERKRSDNQPLSVGWGDLTSVAFSPDGEILAAGYAEGVVLWDVTRRTWLSDEPLTVKEGLVNSVAFSPDRKTLAATFRFKKSSGVVLWDVARRERLVDEPLYVAGSDMSNVAFSPDGQLLAAGYKGPDGGEIVLWPVGLKACLQEAASIANRNLSREEWRRYFAGTPYRATFKRLPLPAAEEAK
jgi:WD40 repeat protein